MVIHSAQVSQFVVEEKSFQSRQAPLAVDLKTMIQIPNCAVTTIFIPSPLDVPAVGLDPMTPDITSAAMATFSGNLMEHHAVDLRTTIPVLKCAAIVNC